MQARSRPLPFFTPTRTFPIPFIGHWPLGGKANQLSYQFNRFTGLAYRSMINTFRRRTLHLAPMSRWSDYLTFPDGRPVPALYCFSPTAVPIPPDYPPHAPVTGYWFLPDQDTWQPPPELVAFLDAGAPPLYIGFGSMGFGTRAPTTAPPSSRRFAGSVCGQSSPRDGAASPSTRTQSSCTSFKMCRTSGSSHAPRPPSTTAVAGTIAAGLAP